MTSKVVEREDLRQDRMLRAAYLAHGAELYRFALRRLGDAGSAQDVVQEVFLRAWRNADRFDPEVASLRVWLFGIARHVVVDEIRRSTARPARAAGLAPADDHGGPGFDERTMTATVLAQALRRINPEQRSALVETVIRGRPAAEVAAEQDIPPGTLRSRLFYGLKSLRTVMRELGVEP